ncbi:hypothetical protein CR152_00330 [Massilia violaceinigra]|uniref:Uncharacterized protein n=1 Tax=Massilia violaceinigra TaxID=2045208 RepID=A0A2D2DDR8_9BURK|nr:hypothetical protein [Massilia violaceinigra]ATQ73125.1 hypothetical protein CR152_00330 [Massilia violaceinigra]
MIKFTADQEKKAMRRDCRAWTKLMAEAWYTSDHPHATDYSAAAVVSDLREVYFLCQAHKVSDVGSISILGFDVLRANLLMCSRKDIIGMMKYFLMHANAANVDYAQNWIEIYLEEVA